MAPSGLPVAARKQRIVGGCIRGTEFLQQRNELLRNRNLSFLPILRMKSPMWFGSYAHSHVLEIDIAPGGEASFRITKSGHQIKLEADFLDESCKP